MVLDQTVDPVIDYSWIPSSAWQCLQFPKSNRHAREDADFLDDVPVLSSTILGLEMLLYEPCIDLRKASELVLSDIGATIQTLRLIGRDYDFASELPYRMGDCIASLDLSTWFCAMSARTFVFEDQHPAATAFWKHARLIAQYAQLVAESLDRISPEDAYLVGLLHEVGAIPKVLGWPEGVSGVSDPVALSALEGSLPLFVLTAIHSLNDRGSSSTWTFILNAAHELAGARPEFSGYTFDDIHSMDTSYAVQNAA
jgi:hypothetical protein